MISLASLQDERDRRFGVVPLVSDCPAVLTGASPSGPQRVNCRTGPKSLLSLGSALLKLAGEESRKDDHVLDYLYCSVELMVIRSNHTFHSPWLHTYFAGSRRCHHGHSNSSAQKTARRLISRICWAEIFLRSAGFIRMIQICLVRRFGIQSRQVIG